MSPLNAFSAIKDSAEVLTKKSSKRFKNTDCPFKFEMKQLREQVNFLFQTIID